MPAELVWFKRDLRIANHAPLAAAARSNRPVLCLFVYEPDWLSADTFHACHLAAVEECLADLDDALAHRNARLTRRVGPMPGILHQLHTRDLAPIGGVAHLWSHEETGEAWSYARDRAVARWAREHNVPWTQLPQTGVIRPLRSRDGWATRWNRRMKQPVTEPPDNITPLHNELPAFDHGRQPSHHTLGVTSRDRPQRQPAGERGAHHDLHSFLNQRGRHYRTHMSSPVTASDACSRLSVHLAWGAISTAQVLAATDKRTAQLRADPPSPERTQWLNSLKSFNARLRWRDHFMQKLEDEPAIEHRNMHRAFDHLRVEDPAEWTDKQHERFHAWADGQTGYPMIDACMRSLRATGWINFRMRAMLVSFLANHLWLHWRPGALLLAKRFTDYEPGIHFSQFQMQAGTTGINTVRIYSPSKQAADHDPAGSFIKRWVPELADVPDEHLPEPQRMPPMTQHLARCIIGEHYPSPIVAHRAAYAAARERLFAVRRTAEARVESARVYRKHGSRRAPTTHNMPYAGAPEDRNNKREDHPARSTDDASPSPSRGRPPTSSSSNSTRIPGVSRSEN